MKRSDTLALRHTPSFKSMTGVCGLTIEHSVFSVMAGLVAEMLFSLFCFVMGLKCVNMKRSVLANRFSANN